jgi:integrase
MRDGMRGRVQSGLPAKEAKKTAEPTFRETAGQWHAAHGQTLKNERDADRIWARLELHVLPFIGDKEIKEVSAANVLEILNRLAGAEKFETASRVRIACSQIFRYAMAASLTEHDPTYAVRGAVITPKPGHFAALTRPADVGHLLHLIDAYPHPLVRHAMQFSALTFLRPGEVRHAEWAEIEGNDLRIPSEKMKMKRPHVVPLARQTAELLQKIQQMTGHGKYVFPSNRSPGGDRPMSENTVLVALRSMGYTKDRMTAHGFRSMASTLLNENGFNRDWIERQLAHVEGNGVRAAYNYAEWLPERREMMQWWADYLDELRGDLKG